MTDKTQPAAALTYPSVAERAGRVAPWLLAIFAISFGWTYWTGRPAAPAERWRLRPWHVRWGLLIAWLVLAAFNIGQLPWQFGYDMTKHLEYVQYIAEPTGFLWRTTAGRCFSRRSSTCSSAVLCPLVAALQH